MDETRLRITEATMHLHERVGPALTTVSAIAEEAGVTRPTVYRHFADEEALVAACSHHWGALHPAPETAAWAQIDDPAQRLRVALRQTYAWAHTAAPMMLKIYRDVDTMPAFVGEFLAADRRARLRVLMAGFDVRGDGARRLAAVLEHALHVRTWESLCVSGALTDDEAIEVMTAAVLAAAAGPPPCQTGQTYGSSGSTPANTAP